MTFQYFFFDTYPGYFLQVLPIALLAGLLYGVRRFARDQSAPASRKLFATLFVTYITGLLCLTLFIHLIGGLWYFLFYHQPSGRVYHWFDGNFDLVPDFFSHFSRENLGNILMFLPFGILYPLSRDHKSWRDTLWAGLLLTIIIELVQPVMGRSFDANDILLNFSGVLFSTTLFFLIRRLVRRQPTA